MNKIVVTDTEVRAALKAQGRRVWTYRRYRKMHIHLVSQKELAQVTDES